MSGRPPATGSGGGAPEGLRIVRLANFVTPTSGGLRTALRHLGEGYAAAGHEPVLVVPGPGHRDELTSQGRVITLPGPELPGTGGYRVLARRAPVAAVLDALAPDRIEVSDRTTLRWTGEWARRRRIPAVMVSHESADGVLGTWGLPAGLARRAGDALNRRTAHAYTRVVCTTAWAAAEFDRIGARNVVRAPLGVDLASWHRGHHDPAVRARHAREDQVLLVLCSRLSPEKRPGDALQALAHLRAGGVDAVLVVAGEGPLRPRLTAQAAQDRLPVTFLGHVADRAHLGALLATADVALAPGPVETFGLAALEALACGTPVVASERSALPAIIGAAGASAGTPREFADAVRGLLAVPAETRRARARARAELHPWPAAVAAFLAAHEAAVGGVPGLDDGAAGAVHCGVASGGRGGEAEPVVHGGGAVVVHGGVASDAHGGEAASGIHGGGVVAVHGGVPSGSRDGGVEPATHGGETASGIRCAEVASDVHGGAAPSQRAVQGDGAPAGSGEAVPEVSPARGQGAQATRVPGVQVQPASLAAVTALGPEDGAP